MNKALIPTLFASAALILAGCGFASAESVNLDQLLPAELQNMEGEPVQRDVLDGKLIGVYFSAEWCPPCRAFTPSLVEFRNKNSADFEVVFVSSDRSAEAQLKYMQSYKMDFLAVPFDSASRSELAETFSVRGIPTLVILDSNGNVITTNGRAELMRDGDKALSAWKSKAGA